MQHTQEQLEELLEEAWSYESREGWEAEGLSTVFIGTVQGKGRLYDIYIDTAGNCWYTVRIITENGAVPEYEAVFGHPQRNRHY